jgi:hypothetical protein
MCSIYRKRFRLNSLRYANRDYSLPGKYFVTICTAEKKEWFGKISDGEIRLSAGVLHATPRLNNDNSFSKNETRSSISPRLGSLSVVIRSYKSAVTKDSHKINFGFKWQRGFHDNIICTSGQLSRIRKYILDNPQNWDNKG